MKAIEVIKLEKKYKDKPVVNKISFSVKENELFSLLGVNGAGKTTTIKMLTCLLKPTSGDALIFGNSIKSDKKIKQIVNISPQETAVAPNLSVKENLEFIAEIYGIKEKTKSINEIIKLLSLEEVKNNKSKTLSGGYKRRLSIAMAIITKPKVLFLDEPTLGLDVLAKRELWKIIKKLKRTTTIILTTHYMEEAEELSDNVAIMVEGSIVEIGTPIELIKKTKAKNFEEAFVKIATKGGNL